MNLQRGFSTTVALGVVLMVMIASAGAYYVGTITTEPIPPSPQPLPQPEVSQPIVSQPVVIQPTDAPVTQPPVNTQPRRSRSAMNTCTVDSDCMLNEISRCTEVCDSCKDFDASADTTEAINQSWCKAEHDRVRAEQVAKSGEFACAACISAIANTQNAQPKCINNQCVKCIGDTCR